MTIMIRYLGPRIPSRHAAQDRKRRPPPPESVAEPGAVPKGADAVSPVRSEQQRAEIDGLNLAFQSAETAVALTGRVSQGLAAVDEALARLYGAVTRAVEDPDGEAIAQRSREVAALLERIDVLACQVRFGEQPLLEGSLGASGDAQGDGLAFVAASPRARSSPAEGYPVTLHGPPLRARLVGERPLTPDLLRVPLRIRVHAGERAAELRTRGGESYAQVRDQLARTLRVNGLELAVPESPERRLVVEAIRYGPLQEFWAESQPAGVLSRRDGTPGVAGEGRHIAGTLNGEPAEGRGELLIGRAGNRTTDGLAVAFTGTLPAWFTALAARGPRETDPPLAEGIEVGRVLVVQRALTFRFGPAEQQSVTLQVPSVRPRELARRVVNPSGFADLAAIRVQTASQARDAARVVERALAEVTAVRQEVEQVLRRRLLPNLEELRARSVNLRADFSPLTDPALAGRLAQYVSARLWEDQGLARQAQVHPPPGAVMRLIN